jgi:hypothetical protein
LLGSMSVLSPSEMQIHVNISTPKKTASLTIERSGLVFLFRKISQGLFLSLLVFQTIIFEL